MTKREFLDIVFALAPNEANAIMDAFDEYVESNEPHWIAVRKEDIDEQPTIQPEIIRCKDCKHFESEYGYCDYYQWNMTDGDFCSKAEKREVTNA